MRLEPTPETQARKAMSPVALRELYPVLNTCPDEKVVRFSGRAVRAAKGRSDAVALKCLDCVTWEPEEVRRCQITDCPLHPFRPYR